MYEHFRCFILFVLSTDDFRNAKSQKSTPVKRVVAAVSAPHVDDNDAKQQEDISQTQIQFTSDENTDDYDADQFENEDNTDIDAPPEDTLAHSGPMLDTNEPPANDTITSTAPLSAAVPLSMTEPLADHAARPRESVITGGLFPLKAEPMTASSARGKEQAAVDDEALYLDFIATVTQDIVMHEIYSARSVGWVYWCF